ncbi:MAG TPA: hypothetical protein VFV76_15925 [Actinomycetes bacterium]|nr:hypothetical protein [Actinomycetes bacterium]
MELLITLAVIIAVPIGLLLWTRRDRRDGETGTDPHGHLDLGAKSGPPEHTRDHDYGAGGSL